MQLFRIKECFFLITLIFVFTCNAQSADDEGDENDMCCEVVTPQQTRVQEKLSIEEIDRQMKIALELVNQGKTTEAAKTWEKLAASNYIPAIINLANLYTSIGGSMDNAIKGRIWYRKLHNLIEKNYPKIEDISNIKDRTLDNLLMHLAFSFEYGSGVKKNRGKAYDLYQIAANRGSANAKKKIAFKSRSEWMEYPTRGYLELKIGDSIDKILQYCKPINYSGFNCFSGTQKFEFEIALHPYPIRYGVGNNKGKWELSTYSENERTSDIEIQKITILVGKINKLAAGEGSLHNDILKQLSKNYNLNRKPTKDELANFLSLPYVDIKHVFDNGRVLLRLIKESEQSSFYDVVIEYRDESSADIIMNSLVKRQDISEY